MREITIYNYDAELAERNLKKSRGCPKCYPYTIKQDDTWNVRYNIVKKYYETHGNLNITVRTIIDGINIGSWLHTQRKCYWNDKLPQDQQNKTLGHISQKRIDLLNELGINW